MSGTQPIIHRPPNVRLDKMRERALKNYMGISNEMFDLFKDVIEEYAIHKLPCVAKSRQKPEEWDDFLSTVNDVLPLRGEYVGNWHINAYFSILRRDAKIQRRWQLTRAERATTLSSSPKKVKYVGKSPPSRRILATPENECQQDVKVPVRNSIPPPAQQDLPSPVRAQPVASPSIPPAALNYPAPAQQDLPSPVRAQQVTNPVRAMQMASPSIPQPLLNYPAPCTTCTFLPPISPYHSKRLRKFFADAEDLIPILNYIGILHDRHLRMLLNWSPADRVAFINSLSSDQVKSADKQRLVTLLTNRPSASYSNPVTLPTSRPSAGYSNPVTLLTSRPSASCSNPVKSPVRPSNRSRRERPYDPIPKPPPDVEQHLTSPDTPLLELMQATTIQSAQEFEEILQAIDQIYAECEQTSSDKDNQWWIQFFQMVYDKWPVMRLYQEAGPEENNWAIKFYLRRKLRGGIRLLPSDPPTTISRQDERHITHGPISGKGISPEVDSPLNQAYPYPGITLSTCPAHHPPDHRLVGQRLQHLLESHGSEELLPAFMTVGIKTDQALITLSQLAKQDRVKPFSGEPNLHLTDLQKFALQMILDRL